MTQSPAGTLNMFNNTVTTFTIGKPVIIYIDCTAFTPSSTGAWYAVNLILFIDGNSTSEQQTQQANNNSTHNLYSAAFLFTPTATSHAVAINAVVEGGFMTIQTDTNDVTIVKIEEPI